MKRFWHSWMTVIATVAMISPVAAQNDLGQLSEIGSYQLILSRAGYPSSDYDSVPGRAAGAYTTASTSVPNQPSAGFYGRPGYPQDVVGEIVPANNGAPAAVPAATGAVVTGDCGGYMDPAYGAHGGVPYGYGGGGCDSGACGGSVYNPGRRIGMGNRYADNGRSSDSNMVIGVRGLIFDRDYEAHRRLSQNPSGGWLYTTDADHGAFGGFEVSLQNRNCNNRGWELKYWGLFPDTATASLAGTPVYATNNFRGFDQLNHAGSGANVWDIYQQGDTQTITRDTDINNIEFNLLNNAGCFTSRRGRRAEVEVMAGFRWFQFDESLAFSSDSTFGAYPATITYNSEIENSLIGFQIGGKSEYCINDCWRFSAGSKMGVYNNRINARQGIVDDLGAYAQIGSGPYAGDDYYMEDVKNDVAFLGELDLGLIRQLSAKSRIVFGYRAIGVAGVALADDQIPYDYTDVNQILRTNSDSALLLHGGYAGLEFCR